MLGSVGRMVSLDTSSRLFATEYFQPCFMHAHMLLVMSMSANGTLFAGEGRSAHSVVPSHTRCMGASRVPLQRGPFLQHPDIPTDELAWSWGWRDGGMHRECVCHENDGAGNVVRWCDGCSRIYEVKLVMAKWKMC
jgi:hypothetical protein